MKILANDFRRQWAETRQATLDAVDAVGNSGWFVLGEQVREFEKEVAAAWGLSYAIGVASGLDALEISLRISGCGPGTKVLTTPLSAFATTLAIVKLGAVPVFCDVDEFGLIDLDRCEDALRRDRDIRFLLPVHLYGHSLDLRRLRDLKMRYELCVIEDCAQSILATHNGIATGSVGQMAATSFYPTKNLGALGDGGAILTDSPALAEHSRALRDYGQTGKYRHDFIGYNSRLDELHAAILRRAHLPSLQRWTQRRREIAAAYGAGIHHSRITVPGAPPGSCSCWHLYPIFAEPEFKSSLLEYLNASGIGAGEHYPTPIFDQPAMQSLKYETTGGCERACRLSRSEVSLPIHPFLSDSEVGFVIETCNRWRT
jgi:dTDP-3-amino-3,4,6-trideoxy-alpha-D-glucose transaminase